MASVYSFWLIFQFTAFDAVAQMISPVAQSPAQVIKVTDADAHDLQDAIRRPLFLPTRRPQPRQPPPVPKESERPAEVKPQTPEPVVKLLGVILAPRGGEAIVCVDDGPARALAEGQTIGAWSLRQVLKDRAIFRTPLGELALAFSPHKPELPDNAPAAAPARPLLLRRRP